MFTCSANAGRFGPQRRALLAAGSSLNRIKCVEMGLGSLPDPDDTDKLVGGGLRSGGDCRRSQGGNQSRRGQGLRRRGTRWGSGRGEGGAAENVGVRYLVDEVGRSFGAP